MTPLARPLDLRPRRLAPLLAVAVTLALGAFAPAAQAQGDIEGDCDFPTVEDTTELSYKCEGQSVDEPLGPEPPGGDEALPGTRRCGSARGTGVIRAFNTNCPTALELVSTRRGRKRYPVGPFDCKDRNGLVTCRRDSTDDLPEGRVTFRLMRRR